MLARRLGLMLALPIMFLLLHCHHPAGDPLTGLLALLPSPSRAQAQTVAFYVNAMDGNDANDGRDPSTAWQTLSRVMTGPIPSGSTVYLKRGSTWHEQLILSSSSITIDAYGSGDLPVIDGATDVAGWTNIGGGLYSLTLVPGAQQGLGNLSENGVLMNFVTWDTDAATTFSGAANGSYSYDYTASTLYIKRASAPGSNAYRASLMFYGIHAVSLHDIVVRNVQIQRFSLHGMAFKDCIRCEVHDSVIQNGGGARIGALYAGNGIEFGNSSSSGIVAGVTVSDIFDSCISPQTYASNQTLSSISIANSQLSRCGFAGVEVSVLSNGGTTGSSIQNVSLYGLTIADTGKGWSGIRYHTLVNKGEGRGIRVQADAGAGSMNGISISRTTVSGAANEGIVLAGEVGPVTIHRANIGGSASHGIDVLAATATTIRLQLTSSVVHDNSGWGIHFDAPAGAGFRLIQNTLANNSGVNLGVWNQAGEATLRNNVFYSSVAAHLFARLALVGATIDNNCYNDFTGMISYAGLGYNSVSDFHSASGFEENGSGGPVDPVNPGMNDFMLQDTSACKSLGASGLGVTEGYDGYPFGVVPSAGAYQVR